MPDYQDRLRTTNRSPSTLQELKQELRAEFEPEDLQDRLRDQLFRLDIAPEETIIKTDATIAKDITDATKVIKIAVTSQRQDQDTVAFSNSRAYEKKTTWKSITPK
ncbi:hypothetical protein H310_15246 [Aphanomyces invadans]|uniref:Uncharacterized protein n=1 Tax=Aphanomyces invadans TaxID=157072 RepID=A0A024T7S1_9STRA|nr:hypothetical protein H310_15246 [Aphanomyces invadans]ETV89913.1 hypothetical protein H310_15246 [Aphanomyces invadans]|eukprot:XP_008881455.1 hypothetical protein H310_15246 [Aphanomyces invadans]